MKHSAYIAVGSNTGDRESMIMWAKAFLMIEPAIAIDKSSAIIETKPLGGPRQRDYLNTIWKISTLLTPLELIHYLLRVEKLLGRKRRIRNGPRTIDLDILFYDNEVILEDDVVIPHRRLHKREFILRLLCELSPGLWHPIFKRSIKHLLREVRSEHSTVKEKA